MSTITSNDVARMLLTTHYKYESKNGFGVMTVKGLKLPKVNFDPFGCIWATVKRRIYERFGTISAATFVYNEGMVSCGFFCSYAECEDNKEIVADQMELFDSTFEQQMMVFKNAIELWLTDEEWGYIPYVDYINNTDDPDIQTLKGMMDIFLEKSGLETEADRKAKAKREKSRIKKDSKDQFLH